MCKSEILLARHTLEDEHHQVLSTHFRLTPLPHTDQLDEHLHQNVHIAIIGVASNFADSLELCRRIRAKHDLPVIIIGDDDQLDAKLEAFAAGCDDYLHRNSSAEELLARIERSRFHKLANEQLRQRIEEASQLAFNAMSNSSDLGVVLNFLIDSTECTNLDELGQLFFRAIGHYRLNCSLQIRARQGVKNMEANGMAKPLESHLLWQLRFAGRFYDFGPRSVINYDDVSVLVRTMPLDDDQKCTQMKDNMLAMLKALQMRVRQLDELMAVRRERDVLRRIAERMPEVTENIRNAYYMTIKHIVGTMDDVSSSLSDAIPQLALSEHEEQLLMRTLENGVHTTHQAFNEGLRIDDEFRQFVSQLRQILSPTTIAQPIGIRSSAA